MLNTPEILVAVLTLFFWWSILWPISGRPVVSVKSGGFSYSREAQIGGSSVFTGPEETVPGGYFCSFNRHIDGKQKRSPAIQARLISSEKNNLSWQILFAQMSYHMLQSS